MLRGAGIGLIAGLCLAVLLLVLGVWGNELNKIAGYSLLVVGFPAVFAIVPALQWLGIRGGLGDRLEAAPEVAAHWTIGYVDSHPLNPLQVAPP